MLVEIKSNWRHLIGMTLKRLAYGLSSTFVLILLVLALVLVWTSAESHKNSSERIEMYDSVRISEELQINLLSHSRESFLYEITKDPQHQENREKEKREIQKLLLALGQHKMLQGNEELLREVEQSSKAYLDESDELQKTSNDEMSLSDSYQARNRSLRIAHQKVAQLTEANLDKAELLAQRATERSDFVRSLAMFVAILSIICLPVIVFLARREIYDPILNLRRSIHRFRKNETLEPPLNHGVQEIREVNEAFHDLVVRLGDQKKTQLRFLAGVAHDLKNPLGAIKMSVEMLAEDDLPPEEQKTMFKIIARQSAQLERMVGDFLDASRIESGELEMKKQKQDLTLILKDAVKLHQQVTNRHRIAYRSIDDKLECDFDSMRIGQVVNNLLSNAIKYSPEGGQVTVTLEKKMMSGQAFAQISVEDEGLGVSEPEKNSIFEPFRRSQSTKETISGVGLGLSISKKIVESHGGQIQVSSSPKGKGSIFTIVLPIDSNSDAVASKEPMSQLLS